jgi:hypothetical protein
MIHALVKRTDTFGEREYTWIKGRDKTDCWRQVDNMFYDDWDYHCTYDIVEFEIDGIRFNAHTGTILTSETYS